MAGRSQNLDLGESSALAMSGRSVAVGMAGDESVGVRISGRSASGGLSGEDIVIRAIDGLVVVSVGEDSLGIRPSSKSAVVGLAQKSDSPGTAY